MRKPPGKEMGYIILPIAIPAGQEPAAALNKNKDYDVVWDVLQALRSHDERFNAYINRIALLSDEPGDDPDGPIDVIDANPPPPDEDDSDTADEKDDLGVQSALFTFEEWSAAIYTKIVKKVGTRTYWEDWAHDVADIAARHTGETSRSYAAASTPPAVPNRPTHPVIEIPRGRLLPYDIPPHQPTRPLFEGRDLENFRTHRPLRNTCRPR